MILHELISYDNLRIAWWLLLGVVLVGFALLDGFDLGIGILLPFLGRTDMERRVIINTVGPVWEGNQVWLILAGGAVFAAWPLLYAVSFSGFYLAMFLVLVGLILRPVGFKYRSKREGKTWRTAWDWALFVGGFLPALIFGVALGNVLQGVPFRFEEDMRIFYDGSFFGLLNPYALLAGILSVVMVVMQGAVWLTIKTNDPIAWRARRAGAIGAVATAVIFLIAGLLLSSFAPGWIINSEIAANAISDPFAKTVIAAEHGWFSNYYARPILWVVPLLGIAGPLLAAFLLYLNRPLLAMLFSSLGIAGIISSVGVSMFPFILPSTVDPNMSLTVWDASSSHLTLFVMLVVACIFVPIILAYTSFVYKVLWGKVDAKDVAADTQAY